MKKKLTLLTVLGLCALLVSCATDQSNNDASDNDSGNSTEVSQETQKLENGQVEDKKSDDQAAANSDQNDLDNPAPDNQDKAANNDQKDQKPKDDFADEENLDKDLNNQNNPQQSPEEKDTSVQNPPPPEVAPDDSSAQSTTQNDAQDSAVPENNGAPVTITGLNYKANENGGTVVISTSGPAQYTTEENNDTNQYVVEIQNANLPKKFSRPYNTKDFSGPIGLINAYKKPGTSNVRIVLQLKKPTNVSVIQQGNSLVLVPGGDAVAESSGPQVSKDTSEQAPEEAQSEEPEEAPKSANELALQSKTLDEFLMGETKFYGKKISIEVVNGELRDVISFISEESGANIVLSDEVTGKISVKLRQIPWDQALVVIMQTKQLGYIRQGNILRIAPMTAIRAETDSARQLLEAQKQLEPLKVKIFPMSYAKAKDLETQVSGFLSTRGSVKADDRTNNLVVKDIAENIARVQKLLQRLDTQTPQVYIEGKVVESDVDKSHQIGINWSTTGVSNAQIGYTLNPYQWQRSGTIGLSALLNLLESDQTVKILSAPHITTLNNQQATISQATQFPVYSTTTSATIPPVSTTTVTYVTAHLTLNVTPQITADGGVILNTEILREIAGAVDPNGGATQARPINSRSAKSSILVNNGQTAVLGGIYSMDNTQSNGGIPVLKDIPVIGWLFGEDQQTYDKNELLIFLTPRVINRDKAFQMSKDENGEGESL